MIRYFYHLTSTSVRIPNKNSCIQSRECQELRYNISSRKISYFPCENIPAKFSEPTWKLSDVNEFNRRKIQNADSVMLCHHLIDKLLICSRTDTLPWVQYCCPINTKLPLPCDPRSKSDSLTLKIARNAFWAKQTYHCRASATSAASPSLQPPSGIPNGAMS